MLCLLRNCLILLTLYNCTSCQLIRKTGRHDFVNGYYRQKSPEKSSLVFLKITPDTLLAYRTELIDDHTRLIDGSPLAYPLHGEVAHNVMVFSKSDLDLDLIAIPFKIRPPQKGVPWQLNTSLSGALYLGHRHDHYHLRYEASPLQVGHRKIRHVGISYGIFTGFGNTFVSPTTTLDQIMQEYDGIVWHSGVGTLIALNKLNIGLTIGFDNLLDKNRQAWIYRRKPWIGFALGLNLD